MQSKELEIELVSANQQGNPSHMFEPDSNITSRSKRIPGKKIWEPYAGREYTVFIDESFFNFFNFTHTDGKFVHSTVGIPTERYENLKLALRPAVDEYIRAVREATGAEPNELKSGDLYKLSFPLRRRLLLKLNSALAANGGFVTGFYTSNSGYVMETRSGVWAGNVGANRKVAISSGRCHRLFLQ